MVLFYLTIFKEKNGRYSAAYYPTIDIQNSLLKVAGGLGHRVVHQRELETGEQVRRVELFVKETNEKKAFDENKLEGILKY